MITKEEYQQAISVRDQAEVTINAYGKQRIEEFGARWAKFLIGGDPFPDTDLRYSASARCHCGAGLAYPRNCGGLHQWDCSAVLKGEATEGAHEKYPFMFYEIKSEEQPSAHGATTRP